MSEKEKELKEVLAEVSEMIESLLLEAYRNESEGSLGINPVIELEEIKELIAPYIK